MSAFSSGEILWRIKKVTNPKIV